MPKLPKFQKLPQCFVRICPRSWKEPANFGTFGTFGTLGTLGTFGTFGTYVVRPDVQRKVPHLAR